MEEYVFIITNTNNSDRVRAVKHVFNCAMAIVEDFKEADFYSLDPYEVWCDILFWCANNRKYVWFPPEDCPEELKGYRVMRIKTE